jgi:hypothetical protein
MTDAPLMAGKYMLVTDGIGKATATGPAALESPAVIRAAPRLPRPTSAPRRAPRRGHLCRRRVRPGGGVPSGRSATWHLPAAGRASQQRRRVLSPPARHCR